MISQETRKRCTFVEHTKQFLYTTFEDLFSKLKLRKSTEKIIFLASFLKLLSNDPNGEAGSSDSRSYLWIRFELAMISLSSVYRPLQKRERTGKEHGCFPFV